MTTKIDVSKVIATVTFASPISSASINNIKPTGELETTAGTLVNNTLTVDVPDNVMVVNLKAGSSAYQ